MHRLPLLLCALVALAVVAASTGVPASAGSCPGDQSVLPGTGSYAQNGYNCAEKRKSGESSIGADKTHSWSSTVNIAYGPYYYCYWVSSSSVTVAPAPYTGMYTATATNWLTPSSTKDNTRHWGTGVLWTLGYVSNWNKGCGHDGDIDASIQNITSLSWSGVPSTAAAGQPYTITATVSPSSATGTIYLKDGSTVVGQGAISGGSAQIPWTPATTGTASLSIAYAGDSANVGAVYPGSGSTPKPVSVTVSGGVSVASASGYATGNVGTQQLVTASVSPSSATGGGALVDATTQSVLAQGAITGGVIQIPWTPLAAGTFTLVIKVQTSAGNGQSYPLSSTIGALIPKSEIEPSAPLSVLVATVGARPSVAPNGPFGVSFDIPARLRQPGPATVVSSKRRIRSAGAGFGLACPAGSRLFHADALTDGPVDDVDVAWTESGATVLPSRSDVGHTVAAQVVCRPTAAKLALSGKIGFGTIRGDTLSTKARSGTLFGGPGHDVLTATGDGSAVWGGLGDDTITISGVRSVAAGGPGADRLTVDGRGQALIVGGRGADVLVGGTGPTVIDAKDGAVDQVTCRSATTRVHADAGDILTGGCTRSG